MKKPFVDRKKELEQLNLWYTESSFSFIPIYGRRRIGKTRLVEEFVKGKSFIFYMADALAEGLQLKALGRQIGISFNDSILRDSGFKDWEQLFDYLCKKVKERMILVFDEFPYLINVNKGISSIFQKGIDKYLKNTSIFLILLGSSVGMMEKEVLFHKAPLYGRRTGSIEVKEMPFEALAEFFPEKPFNDLLQIYAVCGAVPAYLEKIDPSVDIFKNIENNILRKGTFLYQEVEFLLREKFREPRNYFSILKAMSEGKRKVGEIMATTGFEKSMIARYLDILRSLGIIEKEVPVTEKNPEKSKLGLYSVKDRFFSFWFRYVFPNRSRLEIENVKPVIQEIKKGFGPYLGFAFERICLESFQGLMRKGIIDFTSVGRWWDRHDEIDAVALDENNNIIYFGEMKCNPKPVGLAVLEDLKRKASKVKWGTANRKERFMVFSKSGFSDKLRDVAKREDVLLIDMTNLF